MSLQDSAPRAGLNNLYTALSLFKCVVGTGSFFLPFGVLQVGLYGGVFGLLLMGLAATYLNYLVMDAKTAVYGNRVVSYYDLSLELLGPVLGKALYVSIV